MSSAPLSRRPGRHRRQDKAIRPGRSALLAATLGLALSALLVTPAWADTASAPGLNGDRGNQPSPGSVGKADDKSPPGQMLDGSDPNAGYECDTNKGVGPGNPAHTGCSGGGGTT